MHDPDGPTTDPVVAVLETDPTGHRLQYLRHLHDAIGADRCVVLTSELAVRSEEYLAHAASAIPSAVILTGDGSQRAVLEQAIERSRAAGADRLVVPDGDRYLAALAAVLLRRPNLPVEVRLLLMRTTTLGGPERLRVASVVKPLLVQVLRLSRRIRLLFLTDAFGVVTRRRGYPGVRPVKDPVVPVAEVPQDRPSWLPPLDRAAPLVGVFGVISPRKNLPLVVDALAEVPEARLVVAGRLEPQVRAFVESSDTVDGLVTSGRLVLVDRLLDQEELSAALASVDMVAVLHDNDSPSGILAEACARHTPVLVPEGGWLARVAISTGVGVAVPPTPTGVAQGIRRIATAPELYVGATRQHTARLGTTGFTDAFVGE